MTTRREVPLTGDNLAWVHGELTELKSRVALLQQAVEQSRALAAGAAEAASHLHVRFDQLDGQATALQHLQDDFRAVREQIVRAQEDVHSLRQSREEFERRAAAEAERARQDKNEDGRRVADLERVIEAWQERLAGVEEHSRRALEAVAQVTMRLESMESEHSELATLQSRALTTLSRLDQEVQRLSAGLANLQREDEVQRERANTAFEMLRRIEGDIEALQADANRISRIDDRLELVQAERTRHNEQLNDLTTQLENVGVRLSGHDERHTLTETRMSAYQDDLRGLRERLQLDREQLSAHFQSLRELAADMRKRQIAALEKEIRDVRGRALNFGEE